jgi:hypothetical protein
MIHLILLSLLLSLQAFAGKQVTLLVSVSGSSRFLFQSQDTTKKLIDQFRKHYTGIDLPLKIIGNALQEDLHRELLNPDNEALFWVSHANSFKQTEGIGNEDTIIDVEGNNVKDLFQMIHPSLKFMAVLGCKTAPIIEEFKKKGYFQDNQQLVIYSRDKKIEGQREIKKALNAFKKMSSKDSPSCLEKEGFKLMISRKIGQSGHGLSLKIMNRGKFLGLLPSGRPGDIQKIEFFVPQPKSIQDLKLIIDTDPKGTDRISVESEAFDGEWKVFQDVKGRPIGVNQHIYRFSGTIIPKTLPETHLPFKCE